MYNQCLPDCGMIFFNRETAIVAHRVVKAIAVILSIQTSLNE